MSSAGNRSVVRGFTLLEILIVVLLAALLVTVVPSSLHDGVRSFQVKQSARSLAASLRYARALAITQSLPKRFEIDVDARRYGVTDNAHAGTLPDHVDVTINVDSSDAVQPARAIITLYPDGSTSGGEIMLAYRSRAYVIDVDWLTGKVAVAERVSAQNPPIADVES